MLTLLLGILITQGISYMVWRTQEQSHHLELVDKVSKNIAYRMVSTVKFFVSLPKDYRHIVLDQLRQMGGTRFYVSLNSERILQSYLPGNTDKDIAQQNFNHILNKELMFKDISVEFSEPSKLKVHKNDTLLTDLPKKWSGRLLMEPLSPPVVVVQIALSEKEWLYIATLLPVPEFMAPRPFISARELLYLAIMLAGVTVIAFFIIRQQTRPLRALQKAAEQLGEDISHPPIQELGSSEMRAAASAFNRMQQQIQGYICERENLFTAMSHDLKTPITRLRLRAEMIKEEKHRDRLIKDLTEIEQMVHSALAAIKDNDSQEPLARFQLNELLESIKEDMAQTQGEMQLNCSSIPLFCRPQTLKRALSNLIENAIFYGIKCDVEVAEKQQAIVIKIRDFGPGIANEQMEHVFNPFVRLEGSRNRNTGGSGLGMGIARNSIRSLGGDITLENHKVKGLVVTVYLVKEQTKNKRKTNALPAV